MRKDGRMAPRDSRASPAWCKSRARVVTVHSRLIMADGLSGDHSLPGTGSQAVTDIEHRVVERTDGTESEETIEVRNHCRSCTVDGEVTGRVGGCPEEASCSACAC